MTLAYNARTRAEVDSVLEEAKTAGANILKPAQEAFWGGYSGYFSDPDGFLWEVAWNPSSRLQTTEVCASPTRGFSWGLVRIGLGFHDDEYRERAR